jgi:hypothetical protein
MYEINPVATLSQTSVATNMVSTSSANVFTADQRIATLEQKISNLRNAKRTFDGVEILKPARTDKSVPVEQPKALFVWDYNLRLFRSHRQTRII